MRRIILATCVALLASVALTGQTSPAFDPTKFTIAGSFKLPASVSGGSFDYGGAAMAYRASTETLIITGSVVATGMKVAEVNIPALSGTATVAQSFIEPTEGKWLQVVNQVPGTPIYLGGLLVVDTKLCGTLYGNYDGGTGKQITSHWCRPLNFSTTGQAAGIFRIFDSITSAAKARFFAGWLGQIPVTWRATFGGRDMYSGQCCITNSSSTSNGPSAWAHSSTIAANTPSRALVYYSYYHPLGPGWNKTNIYWNGTTNMAGSFWYGRSLVFVGFHGHGPYCYGVGGATRPTNIPSTATWCYDPVQTARGGHAYPYLNQFWWYDAADLQAVYLGTKQPWALIPKIANFDLTGGGVVNGAAFDGVHNRLYLSRFGGDGNRPIIYRGDIGL